MKNAAAVALGRMAKGHPKRYSLAYRRGPLVARAELMRAARAARRAQHSAECKAVAEDAAKLRAEAQKLLDEIKNQKSKS
jgi:hypothetical protein